MYQDIRDAHHLRDLAMQLRVLPAHRCSQLQPTSAEWLYPVQGVCKLEPPCGRLMIPSIEEYRSYCTSSAFFACPWFARDRVEARREPGAIPCAPEAARAGGVG